VWFAHPSEQAKSFNGFNRKMHDGVYILYVLGWCVSTYLFTGMQMMWSVSIAGVGQITQTISLPVRREISHLRNIKHHVKR
jgi:hypothetical protein